MKILIPIVNYRTPKLTIDCLASLAAPGGRPAGAEVVVCDNASGDDSVPLIGAAIHDRGWGSWARIVPLQHNGGFAWGNNAAIGPALDSCEPPEFIWLLNSDTVVRPGAGDALVRLLDERPEVGLVGSRLEHLDGTPQCSAFRFPSLLSEWDEALRLGVVHRLLTRHVIMPPISDVATPIPWVAGASLMIRRAVFEQIGLFDDEFFMYYEEVDFCRRAARRGWRCWYEPASRVIHLIGQSSGVTDPRVRRRRPQYWFDSRRRYFLKHHGPAYLAALDLLWSSGFVVGRSIDALRGRRSNDPPRFGIDYLLNSVFVRGFSS